jgi:hypothetical protein
MEQRLNAGGILDLLTKDELSECMGHNFDTAIRELYRGVDYLTFTGNGFGANPFTIPYVPGQGYTWSVKLVSYVVGTSVASNVYIGTDTSQAPIWVAPASLLVAATWSSNQVVIKDGSPITISGGAIGNYRLHVLQVPTEMQGKL